MIRQHQIRQLAMQVLFLWDTQGQNDPEMARRFLQESCEDPPSCERATELAVGAWEQRAVADRWVEKISPQWPPHRQAAVDRNVLRLAIWEMINTTTPPKIAIDEALELAKRFSTANSAAFINGVLDAILKEHQNLTGKKEC